jgi:hypothetical protein
MQGYCTEACVTPPVGVREARCAASSASRMAA